MKSVTTLLSRALCAFALAPVSLVAATIPGLFNSGVGANGVALAPGSADPHYLLTVAAEGPINVGAVVMQNHTAWLANSPASTWIGVTTSGLANVAVGNYYFRTTFDLTGLEPSTARISFQVAVDNDLPDVFLNGNPTGLSFSGFGSFSSPMVLSSGFVDGVNTLEFRSSNGGTTPNPGGFRVEIISATADVQPPPGTPPTITAHPASATIGLLDPVTFSVSATGSRPFTYVWRHNGTPIPGANGASYTIASVRSSDEGEYNVTISNDGGSATSTAATLNVVFLSPAQVNYEPLGPSSRRGGLTFSEIMYHPHDRADALNGEFIEIYNSNPFQEDISGYRLTGELDYTFPEGTIILGLGFLVVAPAPAEVQTIYGISGVLGGSTNKLNNNGGTIRLQKKSGGVILETSYSDEPPWPVAADSSGHSLVLARPSYGENSPRAWEASAAIGGSPGAADPVPVGPLENVVINEILAHTDLPAVDFVELHNHSGIPADISGCWLTDDADTNKFRINDHTILPPGGFISFTETELGFALSADGDEVLLVNSNQTRVIDGVRFGGQANGVAYGRFPDGAPSFQELAAPTAGNTNAPGLVRDVVINEIMYNPISGSDNDEYVELHNRSASPVNVGGWRFIEGITYTIPVGTVIPAGGYLVVAENAAHLMTNYAGLSGANTVGNFNGSLANGGERLALAIPDTIVSTNASTMAITTNLFYIVVDEVTYSDGGRWGRWSDAGGSSLELIDPRSDNRLPSNWGDSDETSKGGWTMVEYTGVLDLGSGNADRLDVILFDAGEALVDDVEVLVSAQNRVANGTFESGTNGWIFNGTHNKSSLETSGFNSARSVHLRASDRGDLAANHLRTPLAPIPAAGSMATIRAKVRWLRGHPEILLRLKGNWLEAFGRLHVPGNLGTPGAPNSQARVNAGPAITDVSHRPVLPLAGQAIRVTARIADPDQVTAVALTYRNDTLGGQASSAVMVDDGTGPDALAGDGLYTGLIPGQSSGHLIGFRVEATDGFAPSAISLFPASGECLVRIGEIQPPGAFGVYRLWLTAATVNTWATREKLSNENLDGTFVYGSSRAVYNIGGHYSGSSYTSPGYSSPVGALCGYDLAFPDDEPFLGETHIVMDWPVRDSTEQREQMMFWLLDQFALPNMYRRYVIMYVNGLRRGEVMDDIQQPSGATVEQWWPDDSEGTLLKTDCWDEFSDIGDRETGCLALNALVHFNSGGVKKPARYRWVWRPRATRGTANDFSELYALIDAANAPTNTYQASMESLADIDHWMRTFAANDLASYWDAFGNPNAKNTYLYKPEADRWKLMSWDMDVGLGASTVSAGAEAPTAELFPALNDPSMNRLYAHPAFVRLYWNALDEAVNSFFQSGPGTKVDTILAAKYAAFQTNGLNLVSPFVASGGNNISIPAWISQRRTYLLGRLATVNANFAVTTPTPITTNRNLITISGTSPVRVHSIVVNGIAYPISWTSVTAWRMLVPLTNGTQNLVVTGLDRFGDPIPGVTATIVATYTGPDALAAENVVINEIMYNPLVPEASYVELLNRSTDYAFDLSGWRLNGVDFTFPSVTLLQPGQYLVIAKNLTAFSAAYGGGIPVVGTFDGQLDDGGETLTLLKPDQTGTNFSVVDIVTYDDDPPWVATADGQGAALQLVDPAQDNNRASNWSDGSGWRFFSYTGTNSAGAATRLSLFLTNIAADVYLDDLSLVQGTAPGQGVNLIENGGFESPLSPAWKVTLIATNSVRDDTIAHQDDASLHLVFGAGAAALTHFYQDITNVVAQGMAPSTAYTFSFWYLPGTNSSLFQMRVNAIFRMALDVRAARFTPGAANGGLMELPSYPALWFSEVQPDNVSTIADNFGDNDPWLELYNGGVTPISLDTYYLADNYATLTQWAFPPSAVINPGQYLLVWADGEPGETAGANLHTSFRLNRTNGAVVLSRSLSGVPQIVDHLNYNNVGANRSFGAHPPGQSSFRQVFYTPTPGNTNNSAGPLVTLFINEWMAANTTFLRDPMDQDFDDWFEIYNPGASAVDLTGFSLTDDFARPRQSVVPAGISVPAQGYLLVWADEETGQTRTNGDLHVDFRLSQDGERIALYDPFERQVDAVVFARQTNNISNGRLPNGGPQPFYFMASPTPRRSNVIPSINPTIISFTLGGDNVVTLIWAAQAGGNYRVQYKDDLNAPGWTPLGSDVNATGTSASKTDPNNGTQRFYRVLLVQ
jgi:hypothetical protein